MYRSALVVAVLFPFTLMASGPNEFVAKLSKTTTLKRPIESGLDLALTDLADQHGLAGRIVVNVEAFKSAGVENVKEALVKHDRVDDVKLSVVLDGLLRCVQGTYLIRENHLEIVPLTVRRAELDERDDDPSAPHRDTIPLVRQTYTETPLRKVLEELAIRFDRTIIIAPQVGEQGDAPVTARFSNLPLDHAVELLAEMAELAVVRRAGGLFVTTRERAEALKKGSK